jgi:hypothetical protein
LLTIRYNNQGIHINKLLAKNAAIAPGGDANHIHQVVLTFQINMARYKQPKYLALLIFKLLKCNSGINAKKIRKVNGDIGQAANNKKPAAMERIIGLLKYLFFVRSIVQQKYGLL